MTSFASSCSLSGAVDLVRTTIGGQDFRLAIILGSGLGDALEVERIATHSYVDLDPAWPASVAGHAGQLLLGRYEGEPVLIFSGRLHCYQGLTAHQAAFPVRLARRLGARRLLLTNAAGGISEGLNPGDLMFIQDHLNLMGDHPLRGLCEQGFLDLSNLYRKDLYAPLQALSRAVGIDLKQGVLAAVHGPTYETPAEVRMLKTLGADAVSMSTVPEALQAAALGMEVVALSLISNRAAGLATHPLSHEDVLAAGRAGASSLSQVFRQLLRCWRDPSAQQANIPNLL